MRETLIGAACHAVATSWILFLCAAEGYSPAGPRAEWADLGELSQDTTALGNALPVVCASTCKFGKCIGPQAYHCTECPNSRVLDNATTANGTLASYGQCMVCPQSCKPGKCVGRRGDQCTECWKGAVLLPNKNQTHGQCIRCAPNCRFEQCVGPQADQCTGCNQPDVLVVNKDPDAYLPTNQPSGTCTKCSAACKEAKCVGPRSDQCTECDGDRALVFSPSLTGNGTADFGQCVACASNCRAGKCAGKHSYQCLACNDNQVLIKAQDGPHAGRTYGSCISCAYTCDALQCIGEKSWQCTACGQGRTLVPAAEGTTYGYCAANSVVANTALQKELRQQAREIKMLKKEESYKAEEESGSLKESKGADPAKEDIATMSRASHQIVEQVASIEALEKSTLFAASSKSMRKLDLGEASGRSGHRTDATSALADVQTLAGEMSAFE